MSRKHACIIKKKTRNTSAITEDNTVKKTAKGQANIEEAINLN